MATTLEQNQVISSQSMSPVPTIQPVTPALSTVDPSIASNAIASIIGDFGALSQRQAEAQKEQEGIGQSTLALQNLLSGRTADTQSFENTAGVDTAREQQRQYAEQLANLNAQALSLQREAQAIPIQTEQESMGRGRTEAGIAPLNASRLRENALKSLSLAQQADIASASLTGSTLRLQAAKEKAQQMVDIKYKPMEDMLALKKQQYELNKDTLEQLDKKRAEALSLSIKKEERELAERKDIETMVAEATPNAPANVISNARRIAEQGGSKLAVAQAIGVYGGDYLKNELLKQQIATEKAQRSKIYSDMNAKVPTVAIGQIVTPTDIQNATANLKLTEAQSKALAFGQRAINADRAMQKRLETYDPTTIFSATGRLLNTDNARAFQRDLGDFITAVLRKESGATITEDEFDRFIPLYSPQGIMTNQQDVAQTNLKRQGAIDALISEAGPASAVLTAYKNSNVATKFVVPAGVSNAGASYAQSTMSSVDNVNNQVNTQQSYAGYDTGTKE
jgi:hypothetical protein